MQSDLAAALASRRQSMKATVEAEAHEDEAEHERTSYSFSSEPVPEAATRTEATEAHESNSKNMYRAMYDYHGEAHDTDIALRKGDIVDVLDDSDAGWWRARVGDKEGLVPSNFLSAINEDDDDNSQEKETVMAEQETNDDGWGNDEQEKEQETNDDDWGDDEQEEEEVTTSKPFVHESSDNLWDNNEQENSEDDESSAPVCTAFALDINAPSFGTCTCGLSKKDHTAQALTSGVAAPVQHGTYGTGAGNKQSSRPSFSPSSRSSISTKKKVVHVVKPTPAPPTSPMRLPPTPVSPRATYPTVKASPIHADVADEDGACDEFKLDMLAATFGMCKCGHGRGEHSEKARLVTVSSPAHSHSAFVPSPVTRQAPVTPSVTRQAPPLPSPSRKAPVPPPVTRKAPPLPTPPPPVPAVSATVRPQNPPRVIAPTVLAHDTFEHDVKCSSFVLDVNAATFGMCKCGHKRSEHSSDALLHTTVTGSGNRHVLHKPPSPSSSPPQSPTPTSKMAVPQSKMATSPPKAPTPPVSPQVSPAAQNAARAAAASAIANRTRRLDSERPPMIETPQQAVTMLRAVHAFEAAEEDDLSLAVGDEIELIEKVDEGWWKGKRGHEQGIFPAQFVEEMFSPIVSSNKPRSLPEAPKQQRQPAALPSPPPPQPETPPPLPISPKPNLADHLEPKTTTQTPKAVAPPAATPTSSSERYVKAVYDYSSDQAEDLQFHKGDVIQVMHAVDESWLSGKLNDRVGIFPNQFVEETSAPPTTTTASAPPPPIRQAAAPPPPQPKQIVAPKTVSAVTALFDFPGAEAGDLSFKEGQQIEVLEEVDESWLKGRLLGSNTSGIFPRSFVNAPTTVVETASHSATGTGSIKVPPPPPPQQHHPLTKSMTVQYMPLSNGLIAGVAHTTLQRPYTKTNSAPPAPWYSEGHDTFSSTSRYASYGAGPTTKTEEFQIKRSNDRSLVLLTIVQSSHEQLAHVTSDVRPCRVLNDRELKESAEQYGPHIVRFAEQQFGARVGNGECWTLADEALKSVSGVSHALGYTFGQAVSVSEAMPGDIIQLRDCKFVLPNGGRQTAGMPDHTAVVTCKTGPTSMQVLEQNPNPVSKGSYDFNTMVSGTFKIYRVYPQALMPSAGK